MQLVILSNEVKRMKKRYIACFLVFWVCICTIHISGQSQPVAFEIRYDSKTKETYQVKKNMMNTFEDLVSGLHEDDQNTMVIYNIERFSDKNIKAEWKGKLVLTQGDGKGIVLRGDLIDQAYCIEKVQPRSFLQKLFSGK